jgi:hypothetical protein
MISDIDAMDIIKGYKKIFIPNKKGKLSYSLPIVGKSFEKDFIIKSSLSQIKNSPK